MAYGADVVHCTLSAPAASMLVAVDGWLPKATSAAAAASTLQTAVIVTVTLKVVVSAAKTGPAIRANRPEAMSERRRAFFYTFSLCGCEGLLTE